VARRRPPTVHGCCFVDKPAGVTSHDVVSIARRQLNERRIGHAGTLDPDATGLLILGVGTATRLMRFVGSTKSYRAQIVFGSTTSTLDDGGEVSAIFDMSSLVPSDVVVATDRFVGAIDQIPPMVSAKSIDGVRLHELARQGIEVERAACRVTVTRFEVTPTDDPMIYDAVVDCSSGTYIRSLADDLGRALGGGAHLRALRRTAIDAVHVETASPIESVVLRPAIDLLGEMVRVDVTDSELVDISHGRSLSIDERFVGEGPWALIDGADLVAVYRGSDQRTGDNRAVPDVVLSAAS
jgi:tRNA pseudouridine55 synthase